jgi:GWxTD domain-containing protein
MRTLRSLASLLALAGLTLPALLPAGVASARAGEAAAQGLAGPTEEESLADWTARWMEGPVSLIATTEERKLYGALASTREQLQFIRLFWERRDTQYRGARNEFLDEFESRLTYAEEEFTTSREAGWETVFGHVVLLFGKPARTRREMGFPGGFSDRAPILWSYDERLPGMEPNEDMLFVYRAGRWKLMPPYPMADTGIPEAARQAERPSVGGPMIPADYQIAVDMAIEASLVNRVDYAGIIDRVETAVQLPDAQIPFGWSVSTKASPGEQVEVTVELTWRLGALIFHLVDGEFVTDMVVDVQLVDGDDVGGATSERVRIVVPEAEMDSRREEVISRTVTFTALPGSYDLELLLLDQLLGYRTVYRDQIDIERPQPAVRP